MWINFQEKQKITQDSVFKMFTATFWTDCTKRKEKLVASFYFLASMVTVSYKLLRSLAYILNFHSSSNVHCASSHFFDSYC